jgi:organic hydroperoxide reductase OsmC/OhrA
MNRDHFYSSKLTWTGNSGEGTSNYKSYERDHIISGEGKADIMVSSDPAFRGDKSKYNPEELLVASLSSCHMLWFLHLCAVNEVIVVEYTDNPEGIMTENGGEGGKFKEVTLHPQVTVKDAKMISKVDDLHKKANKLCYIANSVNFPVYHKAVCVAKEF